MRDIFDEIFQHPPPDPMAAARRAMRPPLRKRFYRQATVSAGEGSFAVLLDGKPVRTPARHALTAPVRDLGGAIAAEWDAQHESIDPAKMPLTRLANAIIDGVAAAPEAVRLEVERYLGSDLLFYRAPAPEGLAVRQARHWDPVLDWARDVLGARFVLAAGVTHISQPAAAIAAASAAIPQGTDGTAAIWRLGALSVVTTLTGSALLALALAAGALSVDDAWAAAHVDEDWNMEQWGRDPIALERRAFHFTEMQAAARVLAAIPQA